MGNGSLKMLCPWHEEKTPSCWINIDELFYHCFGCGKHGPLSEIMEKSHEAFRLIAKHDHDLPD